MRKIDGRKAVITESGHRWTSFQELANRLGYPDAAVPMKQDKRSFPRKDDVVTILSSVDERGEMVIHDGQRVFIVEFANGERHTFGEKGLRILDEEITGVTVLKDESLGGVERDYREVKRKADVGELVKMYDYVHGLNGEILKVRASKGGAEQFEGKRDGHGSPHYISGRGNGGYVYLTLEPTDILRIDGARFRMIDRKAEVGERVIVTGEKATFSIGKVFVVEDVDWAFPAAGLRNGNNAIDGHYRVLEPLETAETEPLSAKPAPDQAVEIIAKLTTRVTTLEKRVAALEIAPTAPRLSDLGVKAQEAADTFAKATKATSVTVAEVSAVLKQRAKEARQKKRDDIVKRAKEDVADLRKFEGTKIPNDFVNFWPHVGKSTDYLPMHTVEYVVNRDKRTVVAVIRCTADGHITRGIAKCAPGDVFNVWIGKAIALRRALGLEIPEEYVSAPQPTEVRVGDIVKATGDSAYAYGSIGPVVNLVDGVLYRSDRATRDDGCVWAFEHDLSVIDDSRVSEAESDSAEPRKEVA
ncbi:hypothetical protein [Paenibacillus tundrae]|uniref:Uncharacterized protein n=1 Tax=Paenibacillus tundrae TaxID=528187 RepID=A0ABT9W6J2_9BACL|nr:hypothetical protein [Paenibacillus tundrae]MDQ0168740.1 hypothetical protein [Paenibacillus tundrae]